MARTFQLVAVALGAIAVYFLLKDNFDAGFVSGILCIVSLLVGARIRIKSRLKAREEQLSDES